MINKIIADRYRVISLIGSGGMAHVYKAYDQIADRLVAVKVLKEDHKNDLEFVRRFEREAQAVLTLSHPNVVSSYDVGVDSELHYLVLEYVEGSTLKEIITNEGVLTPKHAVNIACQVLDALSHAHERGIIHRDVKPQNVIITPRGKVKLTDFGIARDTASTTRTFAGSNMIGSVHFLSPEQARGDEVTAASDVYSCAIMLYEMLTGTVPFSGDNTVAIALKHLQEDITPPIQLNPKLPSSLSDVIVKAAAKRPHDRYHTAAEMKFDLQRSMREPHGRFARVKADSSMAEAPARRLSVGNISLAVILVLSVFALFFFIIRTIRDNNISANGDYIVPTLIGKSLEEATELAQKRDFVISILGYEPSADYQEGYIIEQTPVKGSKSSMGSTISVIVSMGNDYAVVPDLTGMTIQEATSTLEKSGLERGEIAYEESDKPVGSVIRQSPREGEQVFDNDKVDIWISGTVDMGIQMPKLTGESFENAVASAIGCGFERVWVRAQARDGIVMTTASSNEETIIKQSPLADTATNRATIVELWLLRSFLGSYSADIALNADVTDSEKNVVITAKLKNGAEMVIYEKLHSVGMQQPISFIAYLREGGAHECILYVNGTEARRITAVFNPR